MLIEQGENYTLSSLFYPKITLSSGLKCKVLNLSPYKDPDEFLKNAGKEALQQRIDSAQNPFFL